MPFFAENVQNSTYRHKAAYLRTARNLYHAPHTSMHKNMRMCACIFTERSPRIVSSIADASHVLDFRTNSH